jgi:hypothetical protein
MPVEELGKASPETLSLEEVEIGKNYAPIISTNSGLWRYVIGDTIQFVSINPFRIKVSGRLKHFINAFGEELIIDNSDYAIAEASKHCNCTVSDYTAAPVYFSDGGNGCHEWAIEFEQAPENQQLFNEILDKKLQEINSDYEAKRYKDLALVKPVINVVPIGTFYTWMKIKGKLGGQNKVPRLANNREYIESVLEISETLAKNL